MTVIAQIDLACCNERVRLHDCPVSRREGYGSKSKWTKTEALLNCLKPENDRPFLRLNEVNDDRKKTKYIAHYHRSNAV